MTKDLRIIQAWEEALRTKNLEAILNTYCQRAVLLGTFAKNIKQGRSLISTYFEKLFILEDLNVSFAPEFYCNSLQDGYVLSGIYTFTHREKGAIKKTRARYTFVCKIVAGKTKIINHHSSQVPE